MNLSMLSHYFDNSVSPVSLFSASPVLKILFASKNLHSPFCRDTVIHGGLHSNGFDFGYQS
ncbi:MAG: hypothetical protein M1495_23240 [Bacteroidetes bacterium]|nr:hypothetical protein [Bacteroidota bacterium]